MKRINVYEYDEGKRKFAGWFNYETAARIPGATTWDGQRQVSVHVTDPTDRYAAHEQQTLFRTADGRWALHRTNAWQHIPDTWEWLDDAQAKEWLVANDSDDELEQYFGGVEEERGPGRPVTLVDPVAVNLQFPRALLRAVDQAAAAAGVSRAEWLRGTAAAAIAQTAPAERQESAA